MPQFIELIASAKQLDLNNTGRRETYREVEAEVGTLFDLEESADLIARLGKGAVGVDGTVLE